MWNTQHNYEGNTFKFYFGIIERAKRRTENVIFFQARDASSFPPEGGCFGKCLAAMPCGHICPKICHSSDREHLNQRCNEACRRSCLQGHPCPKKCFEDCHPCMKQVTKVLPCGHTKLTSCYMDPAEEYCQTKVWKVSKNSGCLFVVVLSFPLWHLGNRFFQYADMK